MNEGLLKTARRNHSAILKALAKVGQERIADALGISGSSLSVFKSEHLERLSAVLAACGLKVVLETDESTSADELWALKVLAMKALDRERDNPASGFGGLS